MTESEEELNSLLMKVKEESEKVVLKLDIEKMKIMTSGPITSWQVDGETMETVTDFAFLGSEVTANGDYRYEIKTLAPWKKSYDKPAAAAANSLQSCLTLCDPIAHQALLFLGFSRQEYWSGLPSPSPVHSCMLSRFSCVRLCVTL